MNQVTFAARSRTDTGSSNAKTLRKAGRLPAVVYGRTGTALSIDLDAKEFAAGVRGISESTIVALNIDGATKQAFVKDAQHDILTGTVYHVDFYEVESGNVLRARVPLHIVGTAAGTREGGILEVPMHELEVECLPKDLPEKVDVDISALKANQSIHVRDLVLGAGVRVLTSSDQVVALVKFAKADQSEAAPAEAAAAPKA